MSQWVYISGAVLVECNDNKRMYNVIDKYKDILRGTEGQCHFNVNKYEKNLVTITLIGMLKDTTMKEAIFSIKGFLKGLDDSQNFVNQCGIVVNDGLGDEKIFNNDYLQYLNV